MREIVTVLQTISRYRVGDIIKENINTVNNLDGVHLIFFGPIVPTLNTSFEYDMIVSCKSYNKNKENNVNNIQKKASYCYYLP